MHVFLCLPGRISLPGRTSVCAPSRFRRIACSVRSDSSPIAERNSPGPAAVGLERTEDHSMSSPNSASPAPSKAPAGLLRRTFFGARGLRAGWRFLLYNAVTIAVSLPFALWMKARFHLGDETPFTIELLILIEMVYLGAAFVATAVMAKIEGRRFADYGVPLRRALGGRFWEGTLWGVATLTAVALGVAAFGGLSLAGLRSGPEILRSGLLWLLGCVLIGFTEEISFRGYQLATLADGMGFWPAAVLESLYFGWVLHYLEKKNETVMDGINVSLVALFL